MDIPLRLVSYTNYASRCRNIDFKTLVSEPLYIIFAPEKAIGVPAASYDEIQVWIYIRSEDLGSKDQPSRANHPHGFTDRLLWISGPVQHERPIAGIEAVIVKGEPGGTTFFEDWQVLFRYRRMRWVQSFQQIHEVVSSQFQHPWHRIHCCDRDITAEVQPYFRGFLTAPTTYLDQFFTSQPPPFLACEISETCLSNRGVDVRVQNIIKHIYNAIIVPLKHLCHTEVFILQSIKEDGTAAPLSAKRHAPWNPS